MASSIINALTIDVEDYFQVSAFAAQIDRASWDHRECRVERNVDRILDLLSRHRTKATFFTLGWIAERYPEMVRRIVNQGHELASHGYAHQRATAMTEDEFRDDITSAKRILEEHGGVEVTGYRAPSFSIGEGNLWAFRCLKEAGYRYSSSIYPIRHDHYGMPSCPRFVHRVEGDFIEIPISTLRIFGRNLPSSGGGFFRLYPYALSRWMLKQINGVDEQAAVFYFHPWELDQGQPRVAGISAKSRFRHYVNIHRVEDRLEQLLSDFRWERMDRIFQRQGRALDGAPSDVLNPHVHHPATVPVRY